MAYQPKWRRTRKITDYIMRVHNMGYFRYMVRLRDSLQGRFLLWARVKWYRKLCGFVGDNAYFADGIRIGAPERLFIGNNVAINDDVFINAWGRVYIGNDTMIGANTIILSTNHRFDRLDIPMREQGVTEKAVFIGDDVWLGAASLILPGVLIGAGSVVAAGAVVAQDVPSYSVVAGVPAVVVKYRRNEEKITPPVVGQAWKTIYQNHPMKPP